MIKKETSAVREFVLPLLTSIIHKNVSTLRGIDIGFGGDKIVESFDGCDLPTPYGKYENYPIDIKCDITQGVPVADSTYDVVYSSHLIEDFVDTDSILKEFVRICKPAGSIILVFPDQQKYINFCQSKGTKPNGKHQVPEMGTSYMIKHINALDIILDNEIFAKEVLSYNCIIAFKVKK